MVVTNLGQQGVLCFKLVSKVAYAATKKSDGEDVVSISKIIHSDIKQAMRTIEKGWHRQTLTVLYCTSKCHKLKPRSAVPDSQRKLANKTRACLRCFMGRGTSKRDGVDVEGIRHTQCCRCHDIAPAGQNYLVPLHLRPTQDQCYMCEGCKDIDQTARCCICITYTRIKDMHLVPIGIANQLRTGLPAYICDSCAEQKERVICQKCEQPIKHKNQWAKPRYSIDACSRCRQRRRNVAQDANRIAIDPHTVKASRPLFVTKSAAAKEAKTSESENGDLEEETRSQSSTNDDESDGD